MNFSDEKIIALSKTKIILLILGACVFVIVGVWLLSLEEEAIRSARRNPAFVHGIGLISIIFFGVCGAFAFKKLFDKTPGLVFNSSGILDNASGVSAGLIPWSEVVGAEIFKIQNQKLLIVMVRNAQQYVERGGLLKRALNRANYKMCGSPIAISSNALKIRFSELLSIFNQYKQKYGNA